MHRLEVAGRAGEGDRHAGHPERHALHGGGDRARVEHVLAHVGPVIDAGEDEVGPLGHQRPSASRTQSVGVPSTWKEPSGRRGRPERPVHASGCGEVPLCSRSGATTVTCADRLARHRPAGPGRGPGSRRRWRPGCSWVGKIAGRSAHSAAGSRRDGGVLPSRISAISSTASRSSRRVSRSMAARAAPRSSPVRR